MGLSTPRHKKKLVTKCHTGPRTWTEYLDEQPKLKKMYMKFDVVTEAPENNPQRVAQKDGTVSVRLNLHISQIHSAWAL
jgi:hypothetical protein